jgi:hypothetical protein
MANKARITKLEKAINPEPGCVYALVDCNNRYWVNDQAFSEKEFNALFDHDLVTTRRVGFDIERV